MVQILWCLQAKTFFQTQQSDNNPAVTTASSNAPDTGDEEV